MFVYLSSFKKLYYKIQISFVKPHTVSCRDDKYLPEIVNRLCSTNWSNTINKH